MAGQRHARRDRVVKVMRMDSILMTLPQDTPRTTSLRVPTPDTMFVFGVRVDNIDGHAALEQIRRYVAHHDGGPARTVFFTNVHSIHLAMRDQELLQTINRADLALPDGSGLKIAGRLFGTPIRENLNGTDFLPHVLRHAESAGWTVYLFGARPEALAACRARLSAQYPQLRIVGAQHGYGSQKNERDLVAEINATRPDLLLVALGSPRQEAWVARNAPHLNTRVCFAVGGFFDFISGTRKRAPAWMRQWGIEWVFRFLIDPKAKWDRMFIEIPLFLALVLARRFAPRPVQQVLIRKVPVS